LLLNITGTGQMMTIKQNKMCVDESGTVMRLTYSASAMIFPPGHEGFGKMWEFCGKFSASRNVL